MEKPLFLINRDLSRKWVKVEDWKVPIHGYGINYPQDVFNRHVGIEIEVEQCGDNRLPAFAHWMVERDGSLRGENAYEFKTTFPKTCHDAMLALDEFFTMVRQRRGTKRPELFDFSERTSIHVHVDARDLTESQIKTAVKMYMIFERSFFDLVGRDRRHNIFCIPISESAVLGARKGQFFWGHWEKYCALNLATLNSFGRIEFRLMAGNDNMELIQSWVLLLSCLVDFATRITTEEATSIINSLKTESQYHQLAVRIFGERLANSLTMFPEASDSAASLTKLL
jgi:hypothetical protein